MKIRGRVVKGDGRGRTLGYPTANIAVEGGLDAADGVYAARVRVEGGDHGGIYRAMANLGVKPTFSDGGGGRVLELHLFDFEGDLYGREVTAELREFIRPEQRFPTPDALRDRIAEDEKQIKNILKCT
jgi:riboflavin kinase/FMN adenylyltransferase